MKKGRMAGMGILLAILWFYVPAAANSSDFTLVKKDKTIALYERWIPVGGQDMVREIQAVFYVKSDVSSVIRLLKDPSQGKRWNINASMYEVQAGMDASWTTYIRYDIPWPMDDQDCCLEYRLIPAGTRHKMVIVMFEGKSDPACPVQKGVTRITGTKGKWILEPAGTGELKIIYTITSDKSKAIPRWISDPLVHKNMFQTMIAFKKILENNKP